MNKQKMFVFAKEDWKLLIASVMIVVLVFSGFYVNHAYGVEGVTLTVSVQTYSAFSSSSVYFGNLTPGTPKAATTTLSVATNTVGGWYIQLSGTDQSPTDTVMDLTSDAAVGLTDDTEWTAGSATTTGGTATLMTLGDDVLAFRVMTASGSVPFRASGWWGTSDTWYDVNQKWAGIASSTNTSKIGEVSSNDYQSSTQLISVLYYLDVPATQKAGNYDGALVFTYTAP